MPARAICAMLGGVIAASVAVAQTSERPAPPRPTIQPDGTVKVPAFDLPPSTFISPEARDQLRKRAGPAMQAPMVKGTIADRRAAVEAMMAPKVAYMRSRYPVDVTSARIAGVPVRVILPKAGEADKGRVLINLHGGGFSMCADGCGLLESIPVASLGRYRVITVDYRQGPEHRFPAASRDVAAVYTDLLKRYRPENIGVYGCSAGGALTAQVTAWLIDKGKPVPGAIGIFGAGGVRFGAGDSAWIAGYVDGSFPPPTVPIPLPYFDGTAMDDPLVSPALDTKNLAKFPPALLITGTRAMDLSPAIYTNSQLLKAGRSSRLIVGEGMGHCYIYSAELPEARDAYDQIVRFFGETLGQPR